MYPGQSLNTHLIDTNVVQIAFTIGPAKENFIPEKFRWEDGWEYMIELTESCC